jgi:RNA polymerase sigma-70 factor (ECF subfamily)
MTAPNELRAWVARLLEAMPLGRRPRDLAPLQRAVAAAWQLAATTHPAITVTPGDWFAYVGARLGDGDPAADLARRNAADLYLACGCVRGDVRALEALEALILPEVVRKLAALRLAADQRAEVIQALRVRMLVAASGDCELASYDGRAPLVTWLRVAAAQMAQRLSGRASRHAPLDDDRLDEISPGVPDPSLAYLKRHYGAQFRRAFAEAVAGLTARDRNLLRFAIVDELGIEQIAAIYHVHRATAGRQLRQARELLVTATRDRLRAILGVSEPELDSILRSAMSLSELTLRQVLVAGRGRAVEP